VTVGGDGGQGGQGGQGGEPPDLPLCDTTDIPDPPAAPLDAPPVEVFFALRAIRFGDSEVRASVPGLDLDRADGCRIDCRGEDECGVPEFLPPLSSEEQLRRCDFVDGIDNAGVHLFERLAPNVGTDAESLSAEANAGQWSLILRVREWNGQPDDATVHLALFATPGFGWTPAGEGGGGGAPPVAPPRWDGTDVWPIDVRSLAPGSTDLETPAFEDRNAYVTGGTIVGALGGVFYVGVNQLPVELADGVLIAPMLDVGLPTLRIEKAVFGARWPVQDLIDGLGPLQLGDDAALCNLPILFDTIVQDVCKLVDVTADGLPGACDALSFAIELDAGRMLPGAIVQPDQSTVTCPPKRCEDVFQE
jgi:hypothetical protein